LTRDGWDAKDTGQVGKSAGKFFGSATRFVLAVTKW
jgi:hypothetical protein